MFTSVSRRPRTCTPPVLGANLHPPRGRHPKHNRTELARKGDRLLARAARLPEKLRFLLAGVEELVRVSRDLRRRGRELRAACATLLQRVPGGPPRPGRCPRGLM